MATYSVNISINERTALGKMFFEFINSLPYVNVLKVVKLSKSEDKTTMKAILPNQETMKAIQEVKAGKGIRYKDINDFKEKMYAL